MILVFIIGQVRGEDLLNKFKKGEANLSEKAAVGRIFLEQNEFNRSKAVYKDIVEGHDKKDIPHLFNYATSLLYSGDIEQAIDIYSRIAESTSNTEIKEKIQNNIMHFLAQEKNKKEGKKKEEGEEEKEENKDEKQKGEKGEEKEENKKENGESKEGEEKEEEKEEEEEEKEATPPSPQNIEEREKEIEEKRKLTKTPALLKQLMQDDRVLQQRYLDTTTQMRKTSPDKKTGDE